MSAEVLELKQQQVAEIEDKVKRASGVVIIDYRGITVEEDTALRASLRKEGIDYKVLKNRLALRAFKNAGYEGFDKVFEGPTSVAFSYEDATAPARILSESMKKLNKLVVKGGIVEGQAMDANGISKVASIPSKQVLLGQLVGLPVSYTHLTLPTNSLV